MESHVIIGVQILTGLDTPLTVMARQIALSHHERWDGQGYPLRLAGEAIPRLGRIVAICDVFDALMSARPYKRAWTLDATREHLQREAGRHFDPQLVDLFLAHVDDFVQIRARHLDEEER
jgi:putative two-component system response regulator